MFENIKRSVYAWIAKILIYKVIVLEEPRSEEYLKATVFSSHVVDSYVGKLLLNFKKDARSKGRNHLDKVINYYIVEIIFPADADEDAMVDGVPVRTTLVFKIWVWEVKPTFIVKLLNTVYLEKLIKSISEERYK